MNRLTQIYNKATSLFQSKKANRVKLGPSTMSRIRQDAGTRKEAIAEAENVMYPFRVKLQRMYLNTAENGHIMACIERRKDLTLLRKWEFKNAKGEVDNNVMAYFCDTIDGKTMKKAWFENFISYSLDAIFFGYTLICLGDIENSEFVGLEVVKRWNISPDRLIVSMYEYMQTGTKFLTEEEIKDYYLYVPTPNKIGTSLCGYGLYFELSMYEIFMRNLLGFNGDYVEVNIAPFRQIKTYKTEEIERAELEQIARDMGSNGYAVTDPEVEIVFHASGGSGTGYNAYDNFEKRLEDKIAQIVLGHSDAIKSIPGKLGNSHKESPAQQALEDKQTKDGEFILAIVNKQLFAKMRALGFNIPDGTTACMLNDNEEVENANNVIAQAKEMKSGGLQMDEKYFTEKTKIPVSAPLALPAPAKPVEPSKISNRLREMYG